MNPSEFYYHTLQRFGVNAHPEPVEKVAEAKGVDPELAMLAKVFHDQLKLDGVKYASAELRLNDAFAMAHGYFLHLEDQEKRAEEEKLATYAKLEDYLALHGIQISPEQAYGIALCKFAEQFEDDEETQEKISSLTDPDAFYSSTLAKHGVQPENLEKIASATGKHPEIVKIAQKFYNQLVVDSVKYANATDRLNDAMEMAEAFADEQLGYFGRCEKIAGDLVRIIGEEKLASGLTVMGEGNPLPTVSGAGIAASEAAAQAAATPTPPVAAAQPVAAEAVAPTPKAEVKNKWDLKDKTKYRANNADARAKHLAGKGFSADQIGMSRADRATARAARTAANQQYLNAAKAHVGPGPMQGARRLMVRNPLLAAGGIGLGGALLGHMLTSKD